MLFTCLSDWPDNLTEEYLKKKMVVSLWSRLRFPSIFTANAEQSHIKLKILILFRMPVSSFISLQDICIWKTAIQVIEPRACFALACNCGVRWLHTRSSHMCRYTIVPWVLENSGKNTTVTSMRILHSSNQKDG